MEKALNRGLHERSVNRVILDSRPVHSAIAHNEAIIDAQRKKPKVPVHAIVTAHNPMVRFIGSDNMQQNQEMFAVWLHTLAKWEQTTTPYLFTYAGYRPGPRTGRYALAGPANRGSVARQRALHPTTIFSFLRSRHIIETPSAKTQGVCMVSALYAVLGALLLIKFSFDVVRLRMQYRVSYGDGGFPNCKALSVSTATRLSTFRWHSFCCCLWR